MNSLDRFDTIEVRHLNIHQNYVRLEFSRQIDRFSSIAGFADNFKIGLLGEQKCQSFAK
jgi:hypothetical protein